MVGHNRIHVSLQAQRSSAFQPLVLRADPTSSVAQLRACDHSSESSERPRQLFVSAQPGSSSSTSTTRRSWWSTTIAF
jgi:hypothetical protein